METLKVQSSVNWEEKFHQLEAMFLALQFENQKLRERIQELEEKLNTNSGNSSKPPSQDPFRSKRSIQPTGRKRGGQPGHPGHSREKYSSEQVTRTIDLHPQTCFGCGNSFFELDPISVECRQVVELPNIQMEVTQYNIHTSRCGKCGKHIRAEVPSTAERAFGPRLMGFLTMLTGEARVTKRNICAIAGHLGVKISVGGLCNVHKLAKITRGSNAVKLISKQLKESLKSKMA